MQIQITARHVNLTDALASYVNKKLNRLERYYDHLVWANVILTVEKYRHWSEVVIHSPLHTLRAKVESADLYSAIDLVVDKVEKQLKKIKEKSLSRHHRRKDARISLYNGAAMPTGITLEAISARSPNLWPQSISVVKKVPSKPMVVDEAIRTMDSLGYTFWMFLNKNSKKFNVIFKRTDQTYGILEPSSK